MDLNEDELEGFEKGEGMEEGTLQRSQELADQALQELDCNIVVLTFVGKTEDKQNYHAFAVSGHNEEALESAKAIAQRFNVTLWEMGNDAKKQHQDQDDTPESNMSLVDTNDHSKTDTNDNN